MKEKPTMLSLAEVAEMLHVSRQAILKMVKTGRLPAQKVGRSYIVSIEDAREATGDLISPQKRKILEEGVEKTVDEYKEALKKLGKE